MSNFGIGNFQSDEAQELLREIAQEELLKLAFEKIDQHADGSSPFDEHESVALVEAAIILFERVGSPSIQVQEVEAYHAKALAKWDATCAELWADDIRPFRRQVVDVTFSRLELLLRKDDFWR